MNGDMLLPKRSRDENQTIFTINGVYHVNYSVRNSFDKLERFQSYLKITTLNTEMVGKVINQHKSVIHLIPMTNKGFVYFEGCLN